MPSGIVHERTLLVALPPVAAGAACLAHLSNSGVGFVISALSGYAIGIVITPDMDHHAYTLGRQRLARLGLIGDLLNAWWSIYARLFRHRGVSHAPIVGTLTRWVWMWPAVVLVAIALSERALPALAVAFAFNCLADLIHLALDLLGTRRLSCASSQRRR